MTKKFLNWIQRRFFFSVLILWEDELIVHTAWEWNEIVEWMKCYRLDASVNIYFRNQWIGAR